MRPPIVVPPARIYKRYGAYYCQDCGFQVSPLALCNCKAAPPMSEARGGVGGVRGS